MLQKCYVCKDEVTVDEGEAQLKFRYTAVVLKLKVMAQRWLFAILLGSHAPTLQNNVLPQFFDKYCLD